LTATWAARRLKAGWPPLQESLGRILTVLSMSLPPILVLGFLLRHELVSIIYHGGAYQGRALHGTTQVFGVLLLGLPAQICAITLATLFVVYRETVFNMTIGIANVLLNVLLNWALRPSLGVTGIALSTTVTLTVLAGVYVAGVRRRFGGLARGVVRGAVTRMTASVLVTTIVGVAMLRLLPSWSSRAGLLLIVVVVVTAGLIMHGFVVVSERHRLVPRLLTRLGQPRRAEVLEP
jgi:peptidoglycan biosynthesis protein MviN/MurJ (putative lipid II flippase)